MKKLILFFSALLVTALVSAQQKNLIDVVYLKNGSIIRGIIIEQIPNTTIKLKTSDGNLFIYETSEIEKITKEESLNKSQKRNAFGENHRERRGYIGLSIGPSFAVGDLSELPVGATLSLIDFGYLFNEHIGIAGKWFGAAFNNNGVDYGAGGLLAGLLASTPISPNLNLEGKILLGTALFSVKYAGFSYTTDLYFGYDIGAGLRYNTSDKISLLLNADYLGSEEFRAISLTIGVAYRLK